MENGEKGKVSENQCAVLAAMLTAGAIWLAGATGCAVTKAQPLETITAADRAEMNQWLEREYGGR